MPPLGSGFTTALSLVRIPGLTEIAEMPENAAVIASLITERPLCMPCLSDKAGLTTDGVRAYLRRIERVLTLRQSVDRCRACGEVTDVFAMFRPE